MSSQLYLDISDAYRLYDQTIPIPKQNYSFFHVVNPLIAKDTSDLSYAQPITLQSMAQAAAYARIVQDDIEVTQLAAVFPEDIMTIPDSFVCLPHLGRDITELGEFKVQRHLPLLWDILKLTVDHVKSQNRNDTAYLIYTNIDISLMPHFYILLDRIAHLGIDAFCINRRTIVDIARSCDALPLFQSELGKKHGGLDCVAFKTNLFDSFSSFNSSIGVMHVMRPLMINLMATADNFKVFTDLHATFHLGDYEHTSNSRFADYELFNTGQAIQVAQYWAKDETAKNKLSQYLPDIDQKWLREAIFPPKLGILGRLRDQFKYTSRGQL